MGAYYDDAQGRPIADGWWAINSRPVLAGYFQEELARAGSDAAVAALNVADADFVVQRATEVGLQLGPQIAPQARLSRLEVGKYWMRGFLEWYREAPLALRGDTANHRRIEDDRDAGMLILARRQYPQIDWSLDYISRHDSLWNAASVSAADLDRIDGFWGRAQVQTWQVVRGVFGNIRMPLKLSYGGRTMTLGWEIVHDWIVPKDANHGVGMLTIAHMLGEIERYNKVGASLQSSIRRVTDGYEFSSGSKTHIIALGRNTGDVVTCYRK
jgi:hypothetical protein